MKKLIIALFVMALGVTLGGYAYAATATSTLDVSATVITTCSVATTPIAFPDYDGSAPVYANGDVTVTCTTGAPYNIAIDAGLTYNNSLRHVYDSVSLTQMKYYLYQDAGLLTEWGDSDQANTYLAGASLADTGSGLAQPHTVYGQLGPTGSQKPAGAYSDVVNVTVYY
jgi:spore coat protein U-like protein